MEDSVQQFGTTLAKKVLGRDWEGVRSLLAPWLGLSTDEVREFFESAYREKLKANDVQGSHYPEEVPYVSGSSSDLAFLREKKDWMQSSRPIAAEVTPENFRQLQLFVGGRREATLNNAAQPRLGPDEVGKLVLLQASREDRGLQSHVHVLLLQRAATGCGADEESNPRTRSCRNRRHPQGCRQTWTCGLA